MSFANQQCQPTHCVFGQSVCCVRLFVHLFVRSDRYCYHKNVYYELPVFVLMLQTVSKCRSVFMSGVLFEHCFIIELFNLVTASLK